MRDELIQPFCSKNKIQLPMSWRHSCNAVRYHDKREHKDHFMFKCEVAYALLSKGQTIFTELTLPSRHDSPVCDLLWLEEKMVIEFESEYSEKKVAKKRAQYAEYNVLVFDIKKQTVADILKKIGIDVNDS